MQEVVAARQEVVAARYITPFRIFSIAVLCVAASFYVVRSINWSWQWDSSIMHYVNFLMDHGKAPYRDIIDVNMPGSFFIEGWALRVFGYGDLGWRLYEFSLLGALTASMIVIARPYDWLAGLFAGVLFSLAHGAEGPRNAVQREEVMTVLITVGIAFAFSALRARKPALMLAFGFLLGLSASLKPTAAPLGLVLLLMTIVPLRQRKESIGPYIGFGLGGFAAAGLIIVGFFVRYHAFGSFLDIMGRLVPYYTGIGNRGTADLIRELVPQRRLLYPVLLATLILTINNKEWKNWERQVLALALCFGAFSYVVQRKGFAYHLYPYLAFLFLWIGLESTRAMKMRGWIRALGLVAAVGLLCIIPRYCRSIYSAKPRSALTDALEQDLQRLGGSKLQGKVQCMDMVTGCVGALYRLELVQNTGFIGDYMFFGPPGSSPSPYYRDIFLGDVQRNPPTVLVLTTARLAADDSYDKIVQWPQFVELLNSRYTLDVTRISDPNLRRGYRIYLLKNDENRVAGF
jgi:hypothetical protein